MANLQKRPTQLESWKIHQEIGRLSIFPLGKKGYICPTRDLNDSNQIPRHLALWEKMQLDIIYGDRDVSGAKCAKTPKSRRRKPRQSWELHIDVFLENSLYISCIYFIPSNILIWYAYICTLFLRFLQFISTKMALIYFIWNSWAVAPWLLMTWSQAKLSTKTGWYVFVGVATGGPSSRWYQVWIFFWVIGIKIPSRISVFLTLMRV